MKRMIHVALLLAVLFATATWAGPTAAVTYTTIKDPLDTENYTFAFGIDGNNIVGKYETYDQYGHGFLYDGSTYTTLDGPVEDSSPAATGISGSNIVGNYFVGESFSFLYNGSTYTTLADPSGTRGTSANGISGNSIVGAYYDSSDYGHGFLYNSVTATYRTLDDPLGNNGTDALGARSPFSPLIRRLDPSRAPWISPHSPH